MLPRCAKTSLRWGIGARTPVELKMAGRFPSLCCVRLRIAAALLLHPFHPLPTLPTPYPTPYPTEGSLRHLEVSVSLVGRVAVRSAIEQYIREGGEMPQDALQVVDTAARHQRGADPAYLAVGRNFLRTDTARPIGSGVRAGRGG